MLLKNKILFPSCPKLNRSYGGDLRRVNLYTLAVTSQVSRLLYFFIQFTHIKLIEIKIKSRDSKRLKEAGVPKRPIDPKYSSSLKPGTSGQVPPQRERYLR